MVGFCEHGNEFHLHKNRRPLDHLSNYVLFKDDSVPWSSLFYNSIHDCSPII